MKKILATLSLSLILTGCSSVNRNVSNLVFPPYPNSDQRNGEKVHLDLVYYDGRSEKDIRTDWSNNCNQPEDRGVTYMAAAGSVVAAEALNIAVSQAQEFLKEEAKRYTGSYSAIAIGSHFYPVCNGMKISDPEGKVIDLKEIKLKRSVKNVDNAMTLSFDIEQTIDGTAFQIKPKEISIAQSKAKVTAFDITKPFGFDILAPWTAFKVNSLDELSPLRPNEVDVTAEVSIIGVWVDKEQKGHSELIASRKFKFGKVSLDGKPYPVDAAPQLFPAIPRSYIDKDRLGAGNFIVSVLVTEYDDYAERVMELEQGVEKNKDSFINRLTVGM